MTGVALAAVSAGTLLAAAVNTPAAAADATAPAKSAPAKAKAKSAAAGPPGRSFDFGDWSAYLGSGSSSQFSALKQIDKSNVGQLQVAWTYMAGDGPAPEFGPLVVNGKMYVLGADTPDAPPPAAVGANGQVRRGGGPARNTIVCLDPATGKEIWRHKNTGAIGTRGMTYWQSADGKDRRLFYLNAGMITAINAETGDSITSFGDGGKVDLRTGLKVPDISKVRPLQFDNPGRVYKNLLIMSTPAGAYDYESAPADIHAYDTRTGKLVWVFHTVPEKGEFGYDTWPAKDHEREGGVHNWSESTIDDQLGIMYIRQQPVRQQPDRHRRQHRQAHLALPGDPPRPVGLRLPAGAQAPDHPQGRQGHPDRGPGLQAGLPLCVRPAQRQADLADRGNAGAADGRAGRADLAHPADPQLAQALRPPGLHRGHDRPLHPAGRPGQAARPVQDHAA